ncbi:hypothetical protein ACFQH6_12305 [Halobacteriaceae archaeon GCM10025711]
MRRVGHVDQHRPVRRRAAVVVALFASLFLAAPLLPASGSFVLVALLVMGAFVLVAGYYFYRHGTPDEPADRGGVWDAIPDWQYAGRHVESGGLARGEQERALREVQDQATLTERTDRQRSRGQ